MPCCHIVPEEILRKLAQDTRLPDKSRSSFADTATVDAARRSIRTQAAIVSKMMAAPEGLTATLVPPPNAVVPVSVYTCNHSQALPGAAIPDPDASTDATVNHVVATTRSLARFYQTVFSRFSIDGVGMALLSSVHYGVNYNNAFWNGGQMTYGDGDGQIFIDFSRGDDVIGHELTHGVTQHSLQLAYADEPGGLNESLSDCFGSMFRQWSAGQDVTEADWLIGKDIMGPAALANQLTCLRDMANPAATHCLARQPTQYAQITPGMDPHYSSGPPNLAFYTACMAAGGKSWETIGQIWYRAMTGYGPSPDLRMRDFADRTRSVAQQLFPADPAIATAVDGGWKLVGL